MVSQNVDRILQEVNSLSLPEREQLLAMLGPAQSPPTPPSVDDLAIAAMLRKGIIRQIPRPPTPEDIARYDSWVPVEIEGKPVSESLIEDRR
jgi:hypothetical protein